MPTARGTLGIAVVDDVLYAIGGDSAWYFGVFGVNEQYTPFGYGTIPPVVDVVSPENQRYNVTNVSLVFVVNKPVLWMGYSLDGKENVTITSNTTLADLPNGLHNVTIYAEDTFGNMGASEIGSFTVAKPEPFPIAAVAVASAASIALAGVGVLVYFRKRKRAAITAQ